MTSEEAHAYLEDLQREFTTHRRAYADNLIEANGAAILALEKQIPKKFEIWNGQDCCPTCHALFGSDETRKRLIHWEMDHCKYCGQALDWRGVNNAEIH